MFVGCTVCFSKNISWNINLWVQEKREKFAPYYRYERDGCLVFCSNFSWLLEEFGIKHNKNDWFIQEKPKSCSLAHTAPTFIPLHRQSIITFISKKAMTICSFYYERLNIPATSGWMPCDDLKVICMLPWRQSGFTKLHCLLYEWVSRARNQHWTEKVRT